jgi:transcriptional regulator with XRE-family HTH domain
MTRKAAGKVRWSLVVHEILERRGMAYDDVAQEIGVRGTTVGRWARGESTPQGRSVRDQLLLLHAGAPAAPGLQSPEPKEDATAWHSLGIPDVEAAHADLAKIARSRLSHPQYWAIVRNFLAMMVSEPATTPSMSSGAVVGGSGRS